MAYTPQMERSDEATADGAAPHSRLRQPSGAVPAGAELSNRVVHPLPRPEGAHKAMPSRSTWAGSLAVLTLACIALAYLFRAEIAAAVQVWSNSATFGHAFFIVPISLFLFYRARRQLAAIQPAAAPWAIVPLVLLALLWIGGEMANVMVVKQLAVVGLWQTLVLLLLGWRVTQAALFPLLYLYFAVPLGAAAIPALQDLTAQMVVHLLRLTGIPVFLDGFLIQIPTGSYLVAEACSGVRYLIVSLALGVLAAHLFLHSWPRRLTIIGLSLVIPIITNGIRAYSIILVAHFTGPRTAAEFDHVLYGFFFLAIVTASLLGLVALLRDRPLPHSLTPVAPGLGDYRRSRLAAPEHGLAAQLACGGAAVVLVLIAQGWTAVAKEPPAGPVPALLLPDASAPWHATAFTEPVWRPSFHGQDLALAGSYGLGDSTVELHVAYFNHQREGGEAISDRTNLSGSGKQWRILEMSRAAIAIDGSKYPYVRLLLGGQGGSYIVWYWYRIGGWNTNSPLFGKILELTALFGGERSASVVAIGSRVSSDEQGTDALLGRFLRQHLNSDGTLVRLVSPVAAAATATP